MAIDEIEDIDSQNDGEIDYFKEEVEEGETKTEEETQEGETEEEETPEQLKARLTELEEKNKKLFERAKKAEEKSKAKTNQTNKGLSESEIDNRVEKILLKREGMETDGVELLEKIQKVAKLDGKDITLTDAQSDPLFKSYKEKQEREKRKRDAQISGSSGGGAVNRSKPLTEEEHNDLVKKKSRELLRKNFG